MKTSRSCTKAAVFLLALCAAAFTGPTGPAAAAHPPGIPAAGPAAAAAPAADRAEGVALATGRTESVLLDRITAAGNETDWPTAAAVVVFDSTTVVVEDSGLSHRRHHVLRKILTETGAVDHAALRFDYDPASNRVDILSVRIHRRDSTWVAIDPAAAADVYAPTHMIYWGGRMKVLGLPRLEPGDAIETIESKMGFQIAYLSEIDSDLERYVPPMRGYFYDVLLFQGPQPIRDIHYRLILPREKMAQYSVYNGEVFSAFAFTDSTLVYEWWSADQPAVDAEPLAPDWSDFVPKVVLATVPDWPAKSRWFQEVNEPVFAWNEDIAAKVAELTAGLRTDEEKMAVLLHWVADNIRYSGLNMGEGEGYTLHPGIMTWEDRCGVCKDIAGMLVTMLRAAGYTTYPVMTMAGARVERVPADQFNHCVVAVRQDDGSYVMLDPTWAPQSADIWSRAEGEQHYVIGSPGGEDLAAIRGFSAEENRLRVSLSTSLDATGALAGELTMEGCGHSDTRLRRNLTYITRAQWPAFAAEVAGGIAPGLEVTGFQFGDHTDYGQPMRYRLQFRVPRYAALTDSSVDLALPSARFLSGNQRFSRIVDLPEVEQRHHPALFWAPVETEIEETLELPATYRFDDPLPAQELDRPAAAFSGSLEAEASRIRASQRLTLKKRTIPADEWAGLAEVSDSLASFVEVRLHGVR
ncbi:MAG: DUF3857 domain-containing transglutaminase family protein [Candidatus Eisenbacteria bacterium]